MAEQLESISQVIESIAMFIPVLFLSIIAFWRRNPVVFILAGAAGMFTGFYWYDMYVTNTGLTLGICLMAYGLVCIGLAFRYMFWRSEGTEE